MKILITGDSWGCGEWDGLNVNYRVTHTGIEQYLRDDGYSVENVSRGGYNNLESLAAITGHSFDHLIFFFTDPLRQATFEEFSKQAPKAIANQHTTYMLEQLHQYPTVTLIGGCSRIEAPNIKYLIPSFSELVVPGFRDTPYMTSHEWETHWTNIKNPSNQFKQEILEITESASKKYQVWKNNPDLFWPDGLHGNRKAIKLVYNQMQLLWKSES